MAYNAIFCEHANESPSTCPCERDCYCYIEGSCGRKMSIISGMNYISLFWMVSNFTIDKKTTIKPITVSGPDGWCVTLTSKNKYEPLPGIFVALHPGIYCDENVKMGEEHTLALFDKDNLTPGSFVIDEKHEQTLIHALERLGKWIDYARGQRCCITAEMYGEFLDWNLPTPYCQFCGCSTGIERERTPKDSDKPITRFDRLGV